MMITVFQRYSVKSGNKYAMEMRGWKAFLVESHIFQTHVPKSADGDPAQKTYSALKRLMNASHVLSTIKEAGGQDTGGKSFTASGFKLSFTHFLQLVVAISAVVYPGIHAHKPTQALNKLLKEVFVPLYSVLSNCERFLGSRDALLADRRTLLLLQAYSPNLWAVYLHYVSIQEGSGRRKVVPYIKAGFPKGAQSLEGLIESKRSTFNPLLTESALVRLAEEYSITPNLIPKKVLLEICRQTALQNNLQYQEAHGNATTDNSFLQQHPFSCITSPVSYIKIAWTGVSGDTAVNGPNSTDDESLEDIQRKLNASYKQHFDADRSISRSPRADISQTGISETRLEDRCPTEQRGAFSSYISSARISFCEMIEILSRAAVEGMHKREFNSLFCSPYDKVAALLTVWKLADPEKLEHLKILHLH
mmetsp:Transcript_21671/g.28102  ORF Transcript_21671/g.28102 Transcript_21671/m.28102 type:complete len:420 (-) Transcript_21671:80-1339(-)